MVRRDRQMPKGFFYLLAIRWPDATGFLLGDKFLYATAFDCFGER